MPSIEISQEQADALARGENITLKAGQRSPVLAFRKDAVVLIKNPRPRAGHSDLDAGVSGPFETLWHAPGHENEAGRVGQHGAGSFPSRWWTIVELA